MQAVTIIGPNLVDQSKGTFVVHAAGCKDISKVRTFDREPGWTIEADDLDDVVWAVYSDQIEEREEDVSEGFWDGYENDFHFAPCVHLKRADLAAAGF